MIRTLQSAVLLALGLSTCAFIRATEPVEVLIQGADPLEYTDLLGAMEHPQKTEIGPFSFWIGKLGGHRVALSYTGEAFINCTAATVIGIEEFSPGLIINQGTSGAQVPNLNVHDIIVGAHVLDYGGFMSDERGAGKGSDPLSWTPIPQVLRNPATGTLEAYSGGFAGDSVSMSIALRTQNSMGKVVSGTIGSAHEVNLELDRVAWSHRTYGMDVEEMESGPAAATACAFGVRYIAFRVVSDAPYAGIRFQETAARATSLFTIAFLKNLPGGEP